MLATFWSSHDPNFWQPPSENGNDIEFQNLGVLLTFEKTPSNKKVFSHATLNKTLFCLTITKLQTWAANWDF